MSESSSSNDTTQTLLSQLSLKLTISYFIVSAAVLYYYDCILTLPLEISEIWTGKYTVAKGFYIVNKYITLLGMICGLALDYYKTATDTECNILSYIYLTCSIFLIVALNGIFILRIYAIYERSIVILIIFLVPTIGEVVGTMIGAIGSKSLAYPPLFQIGPYTCQSIQTLPPDVIHIANSLTLAAGAIFDALYILFTAYRTIGLVVRSRKAGINNSVAYIILRDGLLYYLVVCAPSIMVIAIDIDYMRDENFNTLAFAILSAYYNSLQIMMTTRLVLNLKRAGNRQDDSVFLTMTGMDAPTFATNPILGNIGAPLRTGYIGDDFRSDTPNENHVYDERFRTDNIELTTPDEIYNGSNVKLLHE